MVSAMPTPKEVADKRAEGLRRVSRLCEAASGLAWNGFDAPEELYREIADIVSNWFTGGVVQDVFGPIRLNA